MVKRRSRQEKVEGLLREHSTGAEPAAAPSRFQTQFYEDLVAYKVPFYTDAPVIRQRSYIVGRVYIIMHGGGGLSAEACKELREALSSVGLKYQSGTLCPESTVGQNVTNLHSQ